MLTCSPEVRPLKPRIFSQQVAQLPGSRSVSLHSLADTHDPVVDEAYEALAQWEPQHIFRDKSLLFIITKEPRVTEVIYAAMLNAGLCTYVQANRIELRGINQITFLNNRGMSGWVFEGGASLCGEISAEPSSNGNVKLLGRTHLY